MKELNLVDGQLDEIMVQPTSIEGLTYIGTISRDRKRVASVILTDYQIDQLIKFLQNLRSE